MGDRLMVEAVLELERLLEHLRACPECYTNEPCLPMHFLVKDVQAKTSAARKAAREMTTTDRR